MISDTTQLPKSARITLDGTVNNAGYRLNNELEHT